MKLGKLEIGSFKIKSRTSKQKNTAKIMQSSIEKAQDPGQTHWDRRFTLRRSPPGEIWILGAGQRPSMPVELAGASAVVPHQACTEQELLELSIISDYCTLSHCGQVTFRQGKWLFEKKTPLTPLTKDHSQVSRTNQGVKAGLELGDFLFKLP